MYLYLYKLQHSKQTWYDYKQSLNYNFNLNKPIMFHCSHFHTRLFLVIAPVLSRRVEYQFKSTKMEINVYTQ